MAAPNVTVKIVDESFVASGFEDISTTISLAFSDGDYNLLTALGTNADKLAGYMSYESAPDWVQRYNDVFGAFVGITSSGSANSPWGAIPAGYTGIKASVLKSPNPDFTGLTVASSGYTANGVAVGYEFFNGLTGTIAKHWWSAYNYLLYGGILHIGGKIGSTFTAYQSPLYSKTTFPDVDTIFALTDTATDATIVSNIVVSRDSDCVGVMGASGTYTGYAGVSGVAGVCYQSGTVEVPIDAMGKNGICVFGRKVHFGLDLTADNLVTTPLIADYAGCICRTDRDYAPWYSPAGMVRGRILNSIRLTEQVSTPNQNSLYDNGINYAITLPGEGTFFFGDRTLESTTSTFSRINVSRLFIFLTNTIAPLARRFLFEINDEITRQLFINSVTGILDRVQADRGITEYQVICDESNNTASVIDANEFVADILVKPAKSINFITIRFTNQNT